MPCTVNITSVMGVPIVGGLPRMISAITVSGTSSNVVGQITVLCPCWQTASNSLGELTTTPDPTTGNWSITGSVAMLAAGYSACYCDEPGIFVEAGAKDSAGTVCSSRWGPAPLPCPKCPTAIGTFAVGACNPDNTRAVTLTVTLSAAALSPVNVNWFTPPPTTAPMPSGIPAGQTSTSVLVNFPAGSWTAFASLAMVLPDGTLCTPQASMGPFQVTPCVQCPQITVTPTVSGCAPTNAQTSFVVNVQWPAATTNPPTSTSCAWTVQGPAGGSNQKFVQTTGPGVLTLDTTAGWTNVQTGIIGPVDLTQPGNYTVDVALNFQNGPSGCQSQADGFTIPACPSGCPAATAIQVAVSAGSGTCADGKGKSECFDFTPTASNPAQVVRYDWNFGDPGSGAANTASTSPPNTTGTHCYGSPGNYTVTVTAVGPPTCPPSTPASTNVSVAKCSNGGPPDDTSCGLARLLIALLFALFAVTLAGWACLSWPWYVPVGLAVVIALVIGLWVALCHPTICQVLLAIWQSLFTATMALLYVSSCLQVLGGTCRLIGFAWIVTAALAVIFFFWWALRRQCGVGRCQILNALLGAVLDAGAALAVIYAGLKWLSGTFPGCSGGVPAVPAALAVAALALTALLTGGKCTINPIK